MKNIRFLLHVLLAAVAFPALAEDGYTVLYERGSWTILRIDEDNRLDLPRYCSARSGDPSAFFELIGMKKLSCLSAEARQWKFKERTARVGFMIGASGVFVDSGNYFSNGLQVCGPSEQIDLLIEIFWQADGRNIDVYDYRNRKIGSFPGSGRQQVLRRWKACRNAL